MKSLIKSLCMDGSWMQWYTKVIVDRGIAWEDAKKLYLSVRDATDKFGRKRAPNEKDRPEVRTERTHI